MFSSNICRPMYIDSTNAGVPAGDLTVASLLRKNVEPLLKVNNPTARCFSYYVGHAWAVLMRGHYCAI